MPIRDYRVYLTTEDLERERAELAKVSFEYREPGRLSILWARIRLAFTLPPKPPADPRETRTDA